MAVFRTSPGAAGWGGVDDLQVLEVPAEEAAVARQQDVGVEPSRRPSS